MPLTVDKKIQGPPLPANYQAERKLEWDIPLGDVFVELLLRAHGTMTIGVADCTAVQAEVMRRIIRELSLVCDWKGGGLDNTPRAYTPRGVNDLVTGRTVSFAGVALALECLCDVGTPIVLTSPGLTVGAQVVEAVFPLRFWRPRTRRPYSTLIDSRLMNSMKLKITSGILDTLAAGDDTDVLVTDATTTVVSDLAWDLTGVVLKDAPAQTNYDLRRVRTITEELSIRADLQMKLGEAAYYRRLLLLCTDDDVLSDARVTNLKVLIDKNSAVVDRSWGDLQAQAKQLYALETALVGKNAVDFHGTLSTAKAYNVDLEMIVPAGAVVATDRMFCLAEDVVYSRRAAPVGKPVSQGRGRTAGRGRRRAARV